MGKIEWDISRPELDVPNLSDPRVREQIQAEARALVRAERHPGRYYISKMLRKIVRSRFL